LHKLALLLSKKRQFLGENIFKIVTSVPGHPASSQAISQPINLLNIVTDTMKFPTVAGSEKPRKVNGGTTSLFFSPKIFFFGGKGFRERAASP
jgi:hypothetical protein